MVKRSLLYTPMDNQQSLKDIPDVSLIGGKGVGLYWLAVNGFPVPPTWILSTELFDIGLYQARVHGQVGRLWQALQAIDAADWQATQTLLHDLEPEHQLIVTTIEKMSLFDTVQEALRALPSDVLYWAVRSSATVEDNPQHSFAGQFHSRLTVLRHALWRAICEVWAATYNSSVLSYCVQHQAPLPQMAVVLQPMQAISEQARGGVAFSHSPVPGMPGILIQATFGSAETVVQGYGGDLYVVNGTAMQMQEMPPPHIQVSSLEGRITTVAPPAAPALTEAEARQLAALVKEIAERWGSPVDVEFFWPAGATSPVIVQVRSATG